MAAFNLTAQLNLVGPTNVKKIAADIRRELSSVDVTVNVKVDPKSLALVNRLSNSVKDLTSGLNQMSGNAKQVSSDVAQLGQSLNSVKGDRLARDTQKLSRETQDLGKASRATSQDVRVMGTELAEFGRQSGLAIRRFAAFSLVSGIMYKLNSAVHSSVESFIEFDRQVVRLSQVTGKSKDQLEGLVSTLRGLSTGLGVSSDELIQVTATLAQAGLTARQTEEALKALALSVNAPSFDNLKDTTEGVIAAMRQFNIDASDLTQVLGSINAVSAQFAVEAGDIIKAIQRTGGVFASASKGVAEGTEALNQFIAVFTQVRATTRESAETIATGLRTIFARIQRKETIESLREFGVELTDLEGKFVGPYEAIARLSAVLNKLDPRSLEVAKITEELGGFRQIGKVIPLIQQFSTAQAALNAAQAGSGSLLSDNAKAQQALAVQLVKVREEFKALISDIGNNAAIQSFLKITLGLTGALLKLARAGKSLFPILTIIGGLKAVSAATQFAGGFLEGIDKVPNDTQGGKKSRPTASRRIGSNIGGVLTGSGSESSSQDMAVLSAQLSSLTPTITTLAASIINEIAVINSNTVALGENTASIEALTSTILNRKGADGLSSGGKVLGFNSGGVVPGSGIRDTVPAMLTPGEVVMSNAAANKYGRGNLVRMNKYAEGGAVKGTIGQLKEANSSIQPDYRTTEQIKTWPANKDWTKVRPGGKTGKARTTAVENMQINDIAKGYVDYIPIDNPNFDEVIKYWGSLSQEREGRIKSYNKQMAVAYEKYLSDKVAGIGARNEGSYDPLDFSTGDAKFYSKESDIFKYVTPKKVLSKRVAWEAKNMQWQPDRDNKFFNDVAIYYPKPFDSGTSSVKQLVEDFLSSNKGESRKTLNAARLAQKFGIGHNMGGFIQKLMAGGFVEPLKIAKSGKVTASAIDSASKEQLEKTLEILNSQYSSADGMVLQSKNLIQRKLDGLKQQSGAFQFQIAAGFPLGKKYDKMWSIEGRDVRAIGGGLKEEYRFALEQMQSESRGLSQRFADRLGGLPPTDFGRTPVTDLDEIMGQGNIEGAVIEKALALLGAPILSGASSTRPIDYPQGLGAAASKFVDLKPDIPTEVKRQLSDDSIQKAKEELARAFKENMFASGGLVQKFAEGGEPKKEKDFGQILLSQGSSGIEARYNPNGTRTGFVRAKKWKDDIWTVGLSMATSGYGPKLYDVAMEGVTELGGMLTSDRSTVSGDAKSVWDYYFKNRSDVQKIPLPRDAWTGNFAMVDEKLRGAEDTWPPKDDPAWALQSAYKKSPSLINDNNLVKRIKLGQPSAQMALDYFAARSVFADGGLIQKFARGGSSYSRRPSKLVPQEKGMLSPSPFDISQPKTDYYSLLDQYPVLSKEFDSLAYFAKNNNFSLQEFERYLQQRVQYKQQHANIRTNVSNLADQLKAPERFANGGTVPAMVSNGEAFVPPEAAKKIGYDKLNKMNQADRNGMSGFASGGISVFKGPGSGTSDSIGPIGLPVGSFVIREKATKALGLNKGGAVGVIQRFADGSDGGVSSKGLSIVSSVINQMAIDAGASVGQMARQVTGAFDSVKGSGDLLAEDAESFLNEFAKAVEQVMGGEFKIGGESLNNLNPKQQVAAATKLREYVGTVGRDADRTAQQEREKETGRQKEISSARDFKVSEGSASQIQKIIDEQRERIIKAFTATGMSAEFIAGKVEEFNQTLGILGQATTDTNISELIQGVHSFRDATEGVDLSAVQQAAVKVVELIEPLTKLDVSVGEAKRKEEASGFTGVEFTSMEQITDYFNQMAGGLDMAAALAIPATLAKIDGEISAAEANLRTVVESSFDSATGTASERKAIADASPEVQAARQRVEELKSSRTSTAVRAGADAGIETDVTFALIEYSDRINSVSEEIEAAAREAEKANQMEELALKRQRELKTKAIKVAMSGITEGTYQERFAQAKAEVETGDPSSSAFHDLLEMQPAMDAAAQAVEEARLNSVTAAEQLKQLEEKRTELARGATDGLEAVSVALGNTAAGLEIMSARAEAAGLKQQAIEVGQLRGEMKTGAQRAGETDEEYRDRKEQNVFDETRTAAKQLGLVKTRVLSPREAAAEQEKAQKAKETEAQEKVKQESDIQSQANNLLIKALNENTKAVTGNVDATKDLDDSLVELESRQAESNKAKEETTTEGKLDINDAFKDDTYTITALDAIDDFGAGIKARGDAIAAAYTNIEGETSRFGKTIQGLTNAAAGGASAFKEGLRNVNEQFINSKLGPVFKGLSSIGGLITGYIGTAGLQMASDAAGGYQTGLGGSLMVGSEMLGAATAFATAGAAFGPFGTAIGATLGGIKGLIDGINDWNNALEEARMATLEELATRKAGDAKMDFGVFFDSIEPDIKDFESGLKNLNEVIAAEAEIM